MNFQKFLEAIGFAARTLRDDILVFGSQAIHGNFEYAQTFDTLSISEEIDLSPMNESTDTAMLEAAYARVGHTLGYSLDVFDYKSVSLPENWKDRLIHIEIKSESASNRTAYCLEINDIIASKLARFVTKDKEYTEAALQFNLCDPKRVISRLLKTNIEEEKLALIVRWFEIKANEYKKVPKPEHEGLPYGRAPLIVNHFEINFPKTPNDERNIELCRECEKECYFGLNTSSRRRAEKLCFSCFGKKTAVQALLV